jgi:hypothetical protein
MLVQFGDIGAPTCVVSAWSAWSTCSTLGIQQTTPGVTLAAFKSRTRTVLSGGGSGCPDLQQIAQCGEALDIIPRPLSLLRALSVSSSLSAHLSTSLSLCLCPLLSLSPAPSLFFPMQSWLLVACSVFVSSPVLYLCWLHPPPPHPWTKQLEQAMSWM